MRHPFLDGGGPRLAFAHRGGAATGDENTAAAFSRAVDLGYRYIEIDTHATRDGVVVVFHDESLRRMTGRAGRVRDVTWRDLAALRVGGAAVVPRLDEVLYAWPGVRFNIDVKADDAVTGTVAAVRAAGARSRVLLGSFSDARLAAARRAAGAAVATSLAMREAAALWWASRTGRVWTPPVGAVAAQVPPRWRGLPVVDRRFVAYTHRVGLQVHVWTIDEAATINRFLDLGVDGIMTDRLDVLREVFTARAVWA